MLVRELVAVVRGEVLLSPGCLDECSIRGYCKVCESFRDAARHLSKRIVSLSQKKAILMQVRVNQSVDGAKRGLAMQK